MHRTEGANNLDGFYKESPLPPTTITDDSMNALQEEIVNVILDAGLTLLTKDTDTRDQLKQAINLKLQALDTDRIVSTQAQFNDLFERVSANNYKIKDNIHSVSFKFLLGGYIISQIFSGGDTWGNLLTNDCKYIIFKDAAYLYFANLQGYLKIDKNDTSIFFCDIRGQGTAASAITESYLIAAQRAILIGCKTSNRLSNTTYSAFKSDGVPSTKKTMKLIACHVEGIESSTHIYVFNEIYSAIFCSVLGIESTGGNVYAFLSSERIIGCYVDNITYSGAGAFDAVAFQACYNTQGCKGENISVGGAGTDREFRSCSGKTGESHIIDSYGETALYAGSSNDTLSIGRRFDGGSSRFSQNYDASKAFFFELDSSGDWTTYNQGSTALFKVLNSGLFGIGKSPTTNKLEVAGKISIDDNNNFEIGGTGVHLHDGNLLTGYGYDTPNTTNRPLGIKWVTGTIIDGSGAAIIAHGISNAYTNKRIWLVFPFSDVSGNMQGLNGTTGNQDVLIAGEYYDNTNIGIIRMGTIGALTVYGIILYWL